MNLLTSVTSHKRGKTNVIKIPELGTMNRKTDICSLPSACLAGFLLPKKVASSTPLPLCGSIYIPAIEFSGITRSAAYSWKSARSLNKSSIICNGSEISSLLSMLGKGIVFAKLKTHEKEQSVTG